MALAQIEEMQRTASSRKWREARAASTPRRNQHESMIATVRRMRLVLRTQTR
jgi:hypothetical protein